MSQLFGNIKNILIVILIVIILIMQQCSGSMLDLIQFNKKPDTSVEGTVITKIETKWDTVKIESLVYVPKYVTKTITEHDTIPADIDTLVILRDYYSKYFYSDTISLDTLGTIIIDDTVTQNRITSRKVNPTILFPTTTITRDSLISKNEFYWGINGIGNKTQFSYVGGELVLRTKRKKMYGIGIGLNSNLQPTFSGKLLWKIGK